DVIAAIHMRRVGRLVLAAQPHRDQRGEAPEHEPIGIDQCPLLVDVGRSGGKGFHIGCPLMPPRNGGGLGGASFRHLAHSGQAKSIEKQPHSVCGIMIPHLLHRPLASLGDARFAGSSGSGKPWTALKSVLILSASAASSRWTHYFHPRSTKALRRRRWMERRRRQRSGARTRRFCSRSAPRAYCASS